MLLYVVPRMECDNVTVSEDVGQAVVQIKRTGPLNRNTSVYVTTVDGTAFG